MGVTRSPSDVLAELLQLLPSGWAISKELSGYVAAFLSPMAAELSRIEVLANQLLAEIDPREAVYLLPEWEQMFGPDPYGRDVTLLPEDQQRAQIFQRLTARGGQSRGYFIGLAALFGVTITITQFQTSQCGAIECGAADCGGTPAQFYWMVSLPLTEALDAECGAAECGNAYCGGSVVPSPIVPVIQHDAPAHTIPIFSYTG